MSNYNVQAIKINIPQEEIDHFRQILTLTRLPDSPIVPGADNDGSTYGTKLVDLKNAKERLLKFDWPKVEAEMNKFKHYLVQIEGAQIHFIHERSLRQDAIPLLILHGWPFSFWEYKYLIEPLTNPPPGQQAFHVVLPSLPGIFLSTLIPNNTHSTPDVARLFNTLMVDVLDYKVYGAHGGDFGAINLRQTQLNHPDTCKLIHFTGFLAHRPEDFTDDDMAKLDAVDQRTLGLRMTFREKKTGYLRLQTAEVADIGYAVYDGIGMASWVVGKYRATITSAKTPADKREQVWIDQLVNILLYQYTHSAHTSMVMYKQSGYQYIFDAFAKHPSKPGCPMGISSFEGEVILAPKPWIAASGNLVYHKHHTEGGGHIPALVVPDLLVNDLREFFSLHWPKKTRAHL